MSSVWDSRTQTFHGGQEWRYISNFACDFSVTTNGLGTPHKALEEAKRALLTGTTPLLILNLQRLHLLNGCHLTEILRICSLLEMGHQSSLT